jgi:hypothetical protein
MVPASNLCRREVTINPTAEKSRSHSALTRDWHAKSWGWIGADFGETDKEAKRTFAVLVKGMLKRDLKDVTEAVFGEELGLTSVEKVRFRIPTIEGVNGTGRVDQPGRSEEGLRGRGSMEGSDAQLRAVLPCIAGHAVLQVLGLGAYPALL